MSVGFRKSLFGFNSEDVLKYIEKTHRSFAEKEEKLKLQINDLSLQLDELKAQKENLADELDKIEAQKAEIEQLSESVGKLYLVAQTSAKSMIDSTKENCEISENEVSKNIAAVSNAQESLNQLKTDIQKTANDFSAEVARLISELDKTKNQINENISKVKESAVDFEESYAKITNG